MADVHEPEVRSYNMSRIKGKNTKPEMVVRRFLHSNGFRYGLHNKKLPGKPDIILRKYKTAIFVHGCFWHGHNGCKYFVIPKTRTEWWEEKIQTTVHRDELAVSQLQESGWNVIIIWECELRGDEKEATLAKLLAEISLLA